MNKWLFGRHLIGLLCGVLFGLSFPGLSNPLGLFLGVLFVLFINEIAGRWGFGSHWREYRLSSYFLYTGIAVCFWIGALLGSGHIGKLLIRIGLLLSS